MARRINRDRISLQKAVQALDKSHDLVLSGAILYRNHPDRPPIARLETESEDDV